MLKALAAKSHKRHKIFLFYFAFFVTFGGYFIYTFIRRHSIRIKLAAIHCLLP